VKRRKGYLIKRGGTFYATWTVSGKKFCKTTGCTSERDAKKELSRLMEPFLIEDEITTLESVNHRILKDRGELIAIEESKNPPLTLDQAWIVFDRSPLRPDSGDRTLSQYKAEYERFKRWIVREHPGADKEQPDRIVMREIGPDKATAYAQDLTIAKVSASTFNQHINLLSMLWRVLASVIKGAGANPWTGIATKRLNPLANRKRALTPAQFESLLAKAESDPEVHDLFVVLAWTGLRLVDAVKLTWGAVDFARHVIVLAPQKTSRRTGKTVSIPMFPAVKEVLDRRQVGKVINPVRHVFQELVAEYARDGGATLSKRITAIFEEAGMPTSEKRAGQARAVVCYGAHSLRHHFVSAATLAGMPGAMIKSITGHATDSMLEHYQHIGTDLAAEFGKRLGAGDTKALPPADPLEQFKTKMRGIVEGLNGKTWKAIRDELLKELVPCPDKAKAPPLALPAAT
jgi:integrase